MLTWVYLKHACVYVSWREYVTNGRKIHVISEHVHEFVMWHLGMVYAMCCIRGISCVFTLQA